MGGKEHKGVVGHNVTRRFSIIISRYNIFFLLDASATSSFFYHQEIDYVSDTTKCFSSSI